MTQRCGQTGVCQPAAEGFTVTSLVNISSLLYTSMTICIIHGHDFPGGNVNKANNRSVNTNEPDFMILPITAYVLYVIETHYVLVQSTNLK